MSGVVGDRPSGLTLSLNLALIRIWWMLCRLQRWRRRSKAFRSSPRRKSINLQARSLQEQDQNTTNRAQGSRWGARIALAKGFLALVLRINRGDCVSFDLGVGSYIYRDGVLNQIKHKKSLFERNKTLICGVLTLR